MKERSSLPFFEKKLRRAGPAPPNKQLLLARKAFSSRAALAVSMLGRAAELQVRYAAQPSPCGDTYNVCTLEGVRPPHRVGPAEECGQQTQARRVV